MAMSDLRPPEDGHPFPASLHRRQHEVQAVAGRAGCLAAAWTDDTMTSGTSGWTCGFSVSLDRGRSWSPPLFRKHPDFAVTGNPTIAINASGAVFAISMAVDADYRRGVLECACSTDSGASWTPWRTVVSRDHGIPDRPKLLAAASGDLHLVFAAVEPTGRMWKALRSTIQHMTSPDRGQTWSAPRELSVEPRRSRWLIDGFQGPAIAEASRGEASLRGHLRNPENGTGEDGKEVKETSGSSAYVPKEPEKDVQLQYALSFLRGTATDGKTAGATIPAPTTAPPAAAADTSKEKAKN